MTINDPASRLRQRAEAIAREKAAQSSGDLEARSLEETWRTLHELRVHQIELELQNQELREAQAALEASRERYFDLYDLAPVGYCTLNKRGLILEANLTAATLLGVVRDVLVEQVLSQFIIEEHQPLYFQLRQQLLETGAPQACELRMVKKDGTEFWAQLQATTAPDADGAIVARVVLGNISERKQTEAGLRLDGEILANMADGVFLIRASDGMIVHSNEQFEKMFGYGPGELIGQKVSVVNAFTDKNPDAIAHEIMEVLNRTGAWAGEVHNLKKDGTTFWCSARVTTFEHASYGTVWVAVHRDITARKRAEAQIKKLSSAVEQSPASIIITDPSGAIEYVNPKFTRLTGYSLDEVRGQNPRVLKGNKTSADEYHRLWESITQGREWRGEFHNRKKSGEMYWELALISPIVDAEGRITHFLAVKEDITERKEAEATMRQQAALLEITHDAIVVHDLDGRLLFMNQAAETIMGWSFAEAKTRDAKEILVFEPEMTRRVAHEETLRQGTWTGELTLINGQKKELELESRWTLVRDEAGRPQSILMVSTDITRVKALKAQYLRAQRLESIGTLASGIAHDLNNVLSPILMGLEVIKTEVKSEDNLTMIAVIERSARRGADTVKQLLTFARGTAAQKGLLQPRHLLQEIEQLLKRTFPKSFQIYADYPDRPWALLGDPSQIHQVLMNLSVNARDAMPAGGVLFLKLRNQVLGEADVSLHPRAQPGPYVVFEVTDSGQGMPPEVVERIFEPFFTTKPPGQGTGLGLSTVIGIVEEHGGFVLVDTQVGRGTTFSAFLPAAPDAHETPGESSRPESPPRHEEGILLVDDETSIVYVAHQFLTQQGYKVQTAKSASEGLELFQAHRSDIQLVITDLMMPFGDGRQLIQSLRELDPHLPILVMSGMLTPSLQTEILAQGDCRFLVKPFTAEELLAKLRELLPGKP